MSNISANHYQGASIHAEHMAKSGFFQTRDIDVAIERITRLFGPHHIIPAGRSKKINFEHSFAWIANVCLNQLAYGRELRNDIGEFPEENYCVMFPIAGDYAINVNDKRVEANEDTVTVINPTRPVTLEASDDYRNISVRITRTAIDNAIANHLGKKPTKPVSFVPHPQSLEDGAEPMRNLVLQLWGECQKDISHLTCDAVGREIETLLASMLLLRVPNNYSDLLSPNAEIKPSAACTATADFLKQHAREDINLDDVVAASGVARTTLYAEFKKYYGVTPMEFLRKERLRLAHDVLSSAQAASVSVTNVALDCGFNHFSRFARYYKNQFGELPSETLQRQQFKLQ